MTPSGWLQIGFFMLCVLLVTKPLGMYLVKVYDGTLRWLGPLERWIYRAGGVDPEADQHWTTYAAGMLIFSAVSMLLTYIVLRLQHVLPLNPANMPAVPDRQAFETSASFTTNTNWQSYSGESTMSYFSQMTQLAFHNFASAAVGMAVAVAFVRGCAQERRPHRQLLGGSRARDAIRAAAAVGGRRADHAPAGSDPELPPYLEVTTLEGAKQTIAMGPVASQEAIKQIGTNGGGFFNGNAAHPFENPTPWSNFWSMFTIFAIPSALTYMLGRMVKNQRHGWAVWSAMFVIFTAGVTVAYWAEARGNPIHAARGVDVVASMREPRRQHGREGGALRRRQLRAVRDRHHGRVVRRGERDARLLHGARRHGAAGEHAAR